jgi:hypothetical protein
MLTLPKTITGHRLINRKYVKKKINAALLQSDRKKFHVLINSYMFSEKLEVCHKAGDKGQNFYENIFFSTGFLYKKISGHQKPAPNRIRYLLSMNLYPTLHS